MSIRNSTQALAEMTDEGLFERVATAVLRIADPRCIAISHPGVIASGKTRKAPLDGVGFVPGAKPAHLVAIHHTTTAARELKNKWLHDPATVKPRTARGQPTAPPGDLIKTASIVREERKRTPDLKATLILTSNEEPDEAVVRDVMAAGAAYEIDIDVWSRSRLAHTLDTTAAGQWVRWKELGIEQELMSSELMVQLSKESLRACQPFDDPRGWVLRQVDHELRSTRRTVNFVVAESGLGKTVAAYRTLREHVDRSGYGLILPHDLVEQSNTIEQALSAAVRQLHPQLAPGQSPLSVCSPNRPLLILVEDINRSGQPERLAVKIARWGLNSRVSEGQSAGSWVLFCPVWPRVLALMDEQTRKATEQMLIPLDPMTEAEAQQAVIARADLGGKSISAVQADKISRALGQDPLLIALHDFDHDPEAHSVLSQFVERALERAQEVGNDTSADLRNALLEVAVQILRRRRLELFWHELVSWGFSEETLARVRQAARNREVVRLSGPSTNLALLFRHDRVRDWFLVEAVAAMGDELSDGILGEPFFAEVLGAAIVRQRAPPTLLGHVCQLNPLSLFHALRECVPSSVAERAGIVGAITDWLAVPTNFGVAHRQLCGEALAALEDTEGPEVVGLVNKFPYRTRAGQLARLRNGDVSGGVELCLTTEPGIGDSLRDRHIEHAKLKFGGQLILAVDRLLRRVDLSDPWRKGLLRFAGHLRDARLGVAIEICWSCDPSREERLRDYLWAFAQTCETDTAVRYLEPVCAAWAALPDGPEGRGLRNQLAANELRFAFQREVPNRALDYFLARARSPDLRWPITYMLHGIDNPRVVEFVATELARRAGSGSSILSGLVSDHWRRAQEDGRPMSVESRRQLLEIWRNSSIDSFQRRTAFVIWAATNDPSDLKILQDAAGDVDLFDLVLAQRRDRADQLVVPDLVEKIRDRDPGHWWWFNADRVWGPELAETLDYVLSWRRDHVDHHWGAAIEEDTETQKIITLLPALTETVLHKHWDHLRFSSLFIQAALYVGSPALRDLVAASVASAPVPATLFRDLASGWHIREFGHPGVTLQCQILVLEPYLDFLAELDLFYLADACNRKGWFQLRQRFFDHRVKAYRVAWSPSGAAKRFDHISKHKLFFDRDFDNDLHLGVSWSDYLEAMCDWVAERRTLEALQVLANAVAYKGSRADLQKLEIYDDMPRELAEALIEDVNFAVRRRTPH
jgi:hypothetical protein